MPYYAMKGHLLERNTYRLCPEKAQNGKPERLVAVSVWLYGRVGKYPPFNQKMFYLYFDGETPKYF